MSSIHAFRTAWRAVNFLLAVSLVCLAYAAAREWSVRQYLHGFSDAVVSAAAQPEQKIEAILAWMKNGPARAEAARPDELSPRNPENTLNYRQLLARLRKRDERVPESFPELRARIAAAALTHA